MDDRKRRAAELSEEITRLREDTAARMKELDAVLEGDVRTERALDRNRFVRPGQGLTPRQQQVMDLTGKKPDSEIAAQLGISVGAVQVTRWAARKRLGAEPPPRPKLPTPGGAAGPEQFTGRPAEVWAMKLKGWTRAKIAAELCTTIQAVDQATWLARRALGYTEDHRRRDLRGRVDGAPANDQGQASAAPAPPAREVTAAPAPPARKAPAVPARSASMTRAVIDPNPAQARRSNSGLSDGDDFTDLFPDLPDPEPPAPPAGAEPRGNDEPPMRAVHEPARGHWKLPKPSPSDFEGDDTPPQADPVSFHTLAELLAAIERDIASLDLTEKSMEILQSMLAHRHWSEAARAADRPLMAPHHLVRRLESVLPASSALLLALEARREGVDLKDVIRCARCTLRGHESADCDMVTMDELLHARRGPDWSLM